MVAGTSDLAELGGAPALGPRADVAPRDDRRRRGAHFPARPAQFRQERPDVDLRLTVAPSERCSTDLAGQRRSTSSCASSRRAIVDGVEWSPLRTRRARGRTRRRTPRRPHRDVGTVGQLPRRCRTRRAVIAAALRELGAPFEVVAESHQPEVLREMVRSAWVGRCSRSRQAGGLKPARGKPVAERRLVVARRIGATPAIADALVALLDTRKDSLARVRLPTVRSSVHLESARHPVFYSHMSRPRLSGSA